MVGPCGCTVGHRREPFTPTPPCRVEHRKNANAFSEETPLLEAHTIGLSGRAKRVKRGRHWGARHPQGVRPAPALLLRLHENEVRWAGGEIITGT